MTAINFDQIRLPPECDALRHEVRAFLADEVSAGTFDPTRPGHGDSHSKEFSRRIGAKGWIGMTWPKRYGGHERNFLERYVVTEEFRVANDHGDQRIWVQLANYGSGNRLDRFALETIREMGVVIGRQAMNKKRREPRDQRGGGVEVAGLSLDQ